MTTAFLVFLSWLGFSEGKSLTLVELIKPEKIPLLLFSTASNNLIADFNALDAKKVLKYDYLGGEIQNRVHGIESLINWFFLIKTLTALYILKEYLLTETIKKCMTVHGLNNSL